jgi:hypothetical protein
MSKDGWIEVYRTGEELQMELVRGLLTTNGIPVTVQTEGAKELGFILGSRANGTLILRVPPDQAELALELLGAPLLEEEPEEDEK